MMNESSFLHHEACPRCRRRGEDNSGNNLAVYTDHVFCFKCGYRAKAGNNRNFPDKTSTEQSSSGNSTEIRKTSRPDNKTGYSLPSDFVLSLPVAGVEWIKQYELTDKELIRNRIGWSESGLTLSTRNGSMTPYAPCLILPIYDIYGNLLMYQARYFGKDTKLPKYITKGKPTTIIHLLGEQHSGPVVLVEDLISAIKVSRVSRAVPIFGSSPGIDWFVRLSKVTNELVLWLDKDKRRESESLRKRLSVIFDKVTSITTEKDPKSYGTEEISNSLS